LVLSWSLREASLLEAALLVPGDRKVGSAGGASGVETTQANPFNRETLVAEVLAEWQGLLDVVAELFGVPAGLITRVDGQQIEIFLSSKSEGNPYQAGYTSQYPGSGWFCERTLKNRGLLLIPNAEDDPEWRDNAAVTGLHMLSYVGVPIMRPDGELFGTMCYLDRKEHEHNETHIRVLQQVKRLVEQSLRIVLYEREISERDRAFDNLSKIYPICCYCRRIRDGAGAWMLAERYIEAISGKEASHGICPDCMNEGRWRQVSVRPKT
jgi:hypothetical protein